MEEQKKNNKPKLYKQSKKLETYNKEQEKSEASDLIDGVFINKGKDKNNRDYYTISIKDKRGVYHNGFLNDPTSETEFEVIKKLKGMNEEEKNKLLEALKKKE